jgi:glycosyltransferase involved in cell wall biosynthesis
VNPPLSGPRPIALFLHNLYGGGAERAMVNLMGGMVARGVAVDLVLVRAIGPGLAWVPPGVRVVDLNCRRHLSSVGPFVQYLRRERPRALVSALTHSNLYALVTRRLARLHMPVVVVEQNDFGEEVRFATGVRFIYPLMIPLLYRDAEAIIVVSQGAADSFRSMFGDLGTPLRVIHNPIVVPALFVQGRERVEHPWFAAGEPPVLLAVGRLVPQKDFGTLIRAFGLVRRQRQARLLILGEGTERPALEQLVAESGYGADVQLPGFVMNPYAYMAAARGLVLSSRDEGLPSVLIEALALGTQVASTDCPSGPREILQGGRWGRLTPVGDVPRLAEAMIALLDGPAEERPTPEDLAPYGVEAAVEQYLAAIGLDGSGAARVPRLEARCTI